MARSRVTRSLASSTRPSGHSRWRDSDRASESSDRLDGEEQLRQRFDEPPAEQQRGADDGVDLAEPAMRTEPQRSLGKRDRLVPPAGARILRMAPTYQPRAKLGLSASARSTSAIMAPLSLPESPGVRAALARTAGSSPAAYKARRVSAGATSVMPTLS